ncbi:MAG: hypothetical protein WC617_06385 [Rhodanobacter sp.]|jgi:hypothetical protein
MDRHRGDFLAADRDRCPCEARSVNRIFPDALLTLFQLRKKQTAPKLRPSDSRVLLVGFHVMPVDAHVASAQKPPAWFEEDRHVARSPCQCAACTQPVLASALPGASRACTRCRLRHRDRRYRTSCLLRPLVRFARSRRWRHTNGGG